MAAEPGKEKQAGLLSQAQHFWHILLKWKWTAALCFLICVTAALVYSFTTTPLYIAWGNIWIEDDPNILPFEEVQSFGAGANLSSLTRLLRSRTLASDTIDKLKLYENPDFVGTRKAGEKPPDPADPQYREILVRQLLDSITVSSVERTRLVDVNVSSRNPKLAADILNALFDGYIEMIIKKRYSTSEQASELLNTEIAELRTQIEEKERELNKLGSEKDIMPLTANEAPAVSRISDVNSALTAATLDRINRLNYYNQLKAAPLGEIPNAPDGSLIQRLREQYVTLSRQYRTGLATVKPEYPEMQKLKLDLDSATEALQNETQNLIRNAYNDYQAALRTEQSYQRLLDDKKTEAYKVNSNSVIYYSLRSDLENKKALIEALSKRQSETDVSSRLKGLDALNVWIVDKANYPLYPSVPNKRKNVLMGLLLGLAVGIGLALGLEYLDNSVKTSKDISNAIAIPTLGSVPEFESQARSKGPRSEFKKIIAIIRGKAEIGEQKHRRKKHATGKLSLEPRWLSSEAGGHAAKATRIELIVMREPHSIQAESYRSIRTTLLVSSPPGRIKTILFTSSLAKEGKSSTVSNLGLTLAEANKRVVIVDTDLRKPRQSEIFGASSMGPGLSRFLSSNIEAAEIIKPTDAPNLHLIISGALPANPIELLTSERMDTLVAYLKRSYDFVLFDTPPLLAVSDALALGPMADVLILVARAGRTPIPAIKQAKQKFDAHKLKCLGVILNGVDLIAQDGYYAREYSHYSK